MTQAIAHRGPDDQQVHTEPGLAMGVRRLSIVDLAGGRQPLSNEQGCVWVALNGELFDYPDLRRDLLSRGHRLRTRCDTELWVHLYEEWGERTFVRVRGQFSASLWDGQQKTLYLARDRMGICPLFYMSCDGWLLWGSEIKALLASGLIDPRPDRRGINHFFTFFCAGTTRTCFENIKSLPPGHYLKIRNGRPELRRYWDLDFPNAGQERRFANPRIPTEELEHRLRRAVRRRLRADVPVVSYISGGLDSTLVLALGSQEQDEPLNSYTISLDHAGPDERSRSAESAALLDSPLTTVTMDRQHIASGYPELIRSAEGPVLDTAASCMMRLAARVHGQGYKVALTGEGADEALAGYVWFKSQKVVNRFARGFGTILPVLLHKAALASIGGGRAHRPAWASMGGVRTAQQGVCELFAQSRELLFTDRMWDAIDGHCPYDDLDLRNDRIKRWHPLNQSIYAAYKIMLPGLLLMAKGDRVAMNSSVENRYPFLDEEIVSFCAAIDPGYKLKRLTDKWLLRQVAARVLPPAIARRPKTMFRATLSKTFLGPNHAPWIDQLLSPESLRATNYFKPQVVTRLRKTRRSVTGGPWTPARRLSFDMGLTAVIATQLWHHVFCGGGLADLPTWSPPHIA